MALDGVELARVFHRVLRDTQFDGVSVLERHGVQRLGGRRASDREELSTSVKIADREGASMPWSARLGVVSL
jgi:hypothetical protein